MIPRFPHCDPRVLHPRSVCQYCDAHPEWQELREAWGVAFTGQAVQGGVISVAGNRTGAGVEVVETRTYTVAVNPKTSSGLLPCPADFNRPPDTDHDHRRWAGNVATTEDPVNETPASEMLYGHIARPGKRRRQAEGAVAELIKMFNRLGKR